jgi:general stress protein 26
MTDTAADERATISDIVKTAHIALLTTVSEHGELHSRPLAIQDDEFTGRLRFLVQADSEKVGDIARDPQVNVAIQTGDGYLSIAGTAAVTQDAAAVDELWSPFAQAWFPEGREDPSIRVLTVTGGSVEYWTQDSSRAGSLVKMMKSAVTHSTPDLGEHGTVEM